LTRANLSHARLNRAVLAGAQLQLANLTGCSLEGANASSVDLTTTTLTGAVMDDAILQRAILTGLELPDVHLDRADLSGANLRDVAFERAHLQEAVMDSAQLEGADLSGAQLSGADLSAASLQGADLSGANLEGATIASVEEMRHVIIDAQTRFEDVKWGGKPIKDPRQIADRSQRLRSYREVAQIYHDISEMLRKDGFLSEASTYRLLEHRMRRGVLFTTHHYGGWLFSTFLNAISGYGERISRTLVTYLVIIFAFAGFYFVGANYLQLQPNHLSAGEAFIESLVAFHGRGFVSATLQIGDRMAGVTVAEAVCGLLLEAIFIATFSRRFLGF
jgi:Pentapeptide repeats (8 copies)